jgi:hypothetical protein
MKIDALIGLLFLCRDVAHSAHLNTRSFARHEALGAFYGDIVPLADKLAEAYQGRHGLIGPIKLPEVKGNSNIIEFLQTQLKSIESCRYECCAKDDSALQNVIDEIVALFLSTLYKLRFLA